MEKRHINRVNTLRPHRANTPPPRQPFRPGWFEVTIRLLRSEIEYDVDFETYQVSGVSGADAKGRFFLETSEKTADWMMRQVDSAIEDIEAALAACSAGAATITATIAQTSICKTRNPCRLALRSLPVTQRKLTESNAPFL